MGDTVTIARTVVCGLETSQRKNEYVQTAIEEYQQCLSTMGDYMVSVDPNDWEPQSTTVYRLAKKVCDTDILYAQEMADAAYKVAEAFSSKVSNDHSGEYPAFGHGNYVRMSSSAKWDRYKIVENDGGFGLFVKLQKRTDGEWFHIQGGEYQYELLNEIVNGDAELGNIELHLDGGNLSVHITLTREVTVAVQCETPRFMGVDVGDRVIYASAVMDRRGDVCDVHVESGGEQRHYRERLLERQQQRQQSGEQARATGVSEREKFTEQVMHTTSRQIVDQASEFAPCTIVLENLDGYRQTADNPIHDWPYGSLQEKIAYKAKAAGLPVVTVDPHYTSQICRKCDSQSPGFREGTQFECGKCGYQVHADVNAAMNLAQRGMEQAE